MAPVLLVPMIIVMALAAFHRVSHSGCNSTLKALKDGLRLSFTLDGTEMNARKTTLLEAFPVDLRTVKNRFRLDADTTTYAACPDCDEIFAPTMKNGI
ncbi:hypothetical protein SCHPADRAFT_840120, partial [Schizopora paradoxa]